MSYLSRVYRQRNAHVPDESKKTPFFSKERDVNRAGRKTSFFQAKLSVNQPGDSFEKEADSVADSVVNKGSAAPVGQQKKVGSIQRLGTAPEEEKAGTNDRRMERDKEKPFQLKSIGPEKEKQEGIQKMGDPKKEEDKLKGSAPIQKKQEGAGATASPGVSSQIESSAGKGQAMPKNTMREMNASFGVDFGSVRIHKGGEAVQMNKELQAQAFTHGADIYFNEGKYDPETAAGKFLLAHELTHVIQQKEDIAKMDIQKDDDPARRDPVATQPGGPLDTNDQTFTLKTNEDGKLEGCGPVPGTSAGGDNACFSADSLDQIRNYFRARQRPFNLKMTPPANCPPNRWNIIMNACCPPGKHVDPKRPGLCIGEEQAPAQIPDMNQIPVPAPAPAPEKGDYELPDPATQMA